MNRKVTLGTSPTTIGSSSQDDNNAFTLVICNAVVCSLPTYILESEE